MYWLVYLFQWTIYKKNETEQNRIEQKTEGMREKKRNTKDIEIFKRKLKKKTKQINEWTKNIEKKEDELLLLS